MWIPRRCKNIFDGGDYAWYPEFILRRRSWAQSEGALVEEPAEVAKEDAPATEVANVAKEGAPVEEPAEVAKENAPATEVANVAKEGAPAIQVANVAKENAPATEFANVAKESAPAVEFANVAKESAPALEVAKLGKEGAPAIELAEVAKDGGLLPEVSFLCLLALTLLLCFFAVLKFYKYQRCRVVIMALCFMFAIALAPGYKPFYTCMINVGEKKFDGKCGGALVVSVVSLVFSATGVLVGLTGALKNREKLREVTTVEAREVTGVGTGEGTEGATGGAKGKITERVTKRVTERVLKTDASQELEDAREGAF